MKHYICYCASDGYTYYEPIVDGPFDDKKAAEDYAAERCWLNDAEILPRSEAEKWVLSQYFVDKE